MLLSFVRVEESTNVADAETSEWTVEVSTPDSPPREVLRAAAVCDDHLDTIEAIIPAGSKNERGNSIEYCSLYQLGMLNEYQIFKILQEYLTSFVLHSICGCRF